MTRVIGLISGTSVDGIDAALVDITGKEFDLTVKLLAAATYAYPTALRSRILALCSGEQISLAELAELDDAIAEQFALAAAAIQTDNAPAELIGSHGQTVYHRPPIQKGEGRSEKGEGENSELTSHFSLPTSPFSLGYTLQLGRGATIAHLTGITTVSNFRAADIADGGQGAPLVSRVDAYLLSHPQECRCVQNIGGIGNLTYLPARGDGALDGTVWLESVRGWDTGPGNVLLDLAVQHLTDNAESYDKDGLRAASGTPRLALVDRWLQHPFFLEPPPKSTGRELFGQEFLAGCLADAGADSLSPEDLLATLAEFTVAAIAHSYRTFLPQLPDTVLVCGGGSRNLYLKRRLQAHLQSASVLTTDEVGLNADFKEAIAFAVLAYWRQLGIPGNLPHVTGANQLLLLGDINRARK